MPDVQRFVWAASYKSAMAAGGKLKQPLQILDISASLLPTYNPLIKVGGAWMDYLKGKNPIDSYYNTPIINQDKFAAGTKYSLGEMCIWTVKSFGGQPLIKVAQYNETDKTWHEYTIENIPVIKRAYKESNSGEREMYQENKSIIESADAVKRIEQEKYIDEVTRQAAANNIDPDKPNAFQPYVDQMIKEYFGGKIKSVEERDELYSMVRKLKASLVFGINNPDKQILYALENFKDKDIRMLNIKSFYMSNGIDETMSVLNDATKFGFVSTEFAAEAKSVIQALDKEIGSK
jgi:hypothetical protein